MTAIDSGHWAQILHTARINAQPIGQLSANELKSDTFTAEAAYSIQEQGCKLREQAGEKLIGLKMGLTSEAKRKQMDLDSPLYGFLTNVMEIPLEQSFKTEGLIHPKIEPEIVYYFNKAVGPGATREDILAACEWVGIGLEILDSRYEQFKYFSLEDVIADNASSSHFYLGPKRLAPTETDGSNLEMKMSVNGEVVASGNSNNISDGPLNSITQLAELLNQRGKSIPANCLVLAGAATAAAPIKAGMAIGLEVEKFGSFQITID